jgi:hypothetical protein
MGELLLDERADREDMITFMATSGRSCSLRTSTAWSAT